KVNTRCALLAQRQLPLRGRATVINSLVLSTLWYILRLVSLPRGFFQQVRSIISRFVNHHGMKSPFAYAKLCRSCDQGWLGSIDPQAQQLCLQTRWIQQLLQ
ncbi:hypothetical protein BD408DRAFT_319690, partial [Parasitella parasitica]